MTITFVTGVSCAGKTTLADHLTVDGTAHVLEVDGKGTPDAGHLAWLQWRSEQLLYEAAQVDDGRPVVVCGIVWPHKVIESNAWDELPRGTRVRFVMLDLPDRVIRQRLRERLHGRPKADVTEHVRYNLRLARSLRRQVANQRYGEVLKADGLSSPEIAAAILNGDGAH